MLLVDDNEDNLRLLTRYATGTRYNILGIQHPHEIAEFIKAISPRIIVLDVMMPDVDGWELLQRLRRDPRSSTIPVVLCTILAQRELALALGAEDLLTKPVSRTTFLATLDRLWRAQAQGYA